jgi:FkbM family methyltransferase
MQAMNKRRFTLALAGVVLVLVAVALHRPIGFFALLASGRSDTCPPLQAVDGFIGKHAMEKKLRKQYAQELRLSLTDPGGYELWETADSRFWLPPGSERMALWLVTTMDRRIYESGQCRVVPGDTVLDCGAHVGLFARQALSAGAALVVAVEPAPENLECLRRNLAAEIRSGRVLVYPRGVWDRDESLVLRTVPGFSAGDSVVLGGTAAREGPVVELTTIDHLVSELELARVDYIKMNIEGAELRAIRGAANTLARFRPKLAVAVLHDPHDAEQMVRLVGEAWPGYRTTCGPCFVTDHWRIAPEVLLFHR